MQFIQLMSNPIVGGTETFAISLAGELERKNVRCRIVNLCGDSQMEPLARAAGVGYEEIPMSGPFGLSALRRLHALVADSNPDLICAYGIRASLMLRTLVVRRRRPILLTGLRGMDGWRRWYHISTDRLTEGAIDCFVGNSRAVCDRRLQREGTPRDRVVCIPNGIDTRRYQNRVAVTGDSRVPGTTLCVTIANFREVKGHDFLLRALVEWKSMPSNLRFLWVGNGLLKGRLADVLRSSGLGDKVLLLDGMTDIRPILASADFFVLPSREEGMPRALMEAMAMGLPCVATRVGGVPELIRCGQDGMLVDYGDVAGLRRCMSELATNGGLRSKLGTQAATRIKESFDIRRVATQHIELFLSLLAARRRKEG